MSAQLESSLRGLAAELKRSEGGFTSWLTGSLSTQHADVKNALDAALAKLRSASKVVDVDDVRSAVR
jgi:adenylylsulfate kinase-like enzyme